MIINIKRLIHNALCIDLTYLVSLSTTNKKNVLDFKMQSSADNDPAI